MAFIAQSDFVLVRCVARVPNPCMLQHLSKVRLAVKEPRACLPWFTRKRVIATFRFGGDGAWEQREADGMFEQYTNYDFVNLGRLRRLQEDLRVKVKVWAQRRVDSARLTKRLGDFLDYMPALPRLTLQMTVTFAGAKLGWLVPRSALGRLALQGDSPVNVEAADEGSVHSEPATTPAVPATTPAVSATTPAVPGSHTRRVPSAPSRPSLPCRPPPRRRKPLRRRGHTAPAAAATTTKAPSSEVLLTFLFLAGLLCLLEYCTGRTYFEA